MNLCCFDKRNQKQIEQLQTGSKGAEKYNEGVIKPPEVPGQEPRQNSRMQQPESEQSGSSATTEQQKFPVSLPIKSDAYMNYILTNLFANPANESNLDNKIVEIKREESTLQVLLKDGSTEYIVDALMVYATQRELVSNFRLKFNKSLLSFEVNGSIPKSEIYYVIQQQRNTENSYKSEGEQKDNTDIRNTYTFDKEI